MGEHGVVKGFWLTHRSYYDGWVAHASIWGHLFFTETSDLSPSFVLRLQNISPSLYITDFSLYGSNSIHTKRCCCFSPAVIPHLLYPSACCTTFLHISTVKFLERKILYTPSAPILLNPLHSSFGPGRSTETAYVKVSNTPSTLPPVSSALHSAHSPASGIWHCWSLLPSWNTLWFGFRDSASSGFSLYFIFPHQLLTSISCSRAQYLDLPLYLLPRWFHSASGL